MLLAAAPHEDGLDATPSQPPQPKKQKDTPPRRSAFGWLPSSPAEALEMLTRQSPYMLLSGVTATSAVVYVGGMVARIW